MNTNTKVALSFAGVLVVGVVAFGAIAAFQNVGTKAAPAVNETTGLASTVETNSYRLDDVPESPVTVVEFLDFECEACGAFYPVVEDLRVKYEGQITYVIRYFPIPSHGNAENAALAVEAAAQQGELEAMYNRMFETQTSWGESSESKADLFRTYAEEIGLDMAQYDASVADPKSLERIKFDFEAGRALGVSGTPTFFINDKKVELASIDDLDNAIADELGK